MATTTEDLWRLVKGRPYVDAAQLAEAIQAAAGQGPLDFRTRLLIRDSLEALRRSWSPRRWDGWLAGSPVRDALQAIWHEDLGEPGFPSLEGRLVTPTDPEDIRRFFRDLSRHVARPVRLLVGGSAALILPGYLTRATDDIDVVNEVPAEVRSLHKVLQELRNRYGFHLAHFQSHYLPQGWEKRVHSLEPFGQLQVFLVDAGDVFISKLFSARSKDRDDLQALVSHLDKETLTRRVREATTSLRTEDKLRQAAENNWNVLFGEPLPS
jgi:hypothetical protein